jgi:TPR repeat protein
VPADPGLAAHWLVRAAGAGDAEAALELARMLEQGAGIEREPDAARAWCELAAERGDAAAAFFAGLAHATGRFGAPDLAAAARFWRRAADLGHGLAAVNLARLVMAGAGVPRDPAAAERLLLEAAERGEPHAPAALAELYGLFWPRPDPQRAAAWLDRARAAGDRVAEAVAGRLARAGLGLPRAPAVCGPDPPTVASEVDRRED